MEIQLRRMRSEEAGLVAGLLLRANEENLSAFPLDVAQAYRSELLDVAGRSAQVHTLVLQVEGRLAGSVALVLDAAHDTHPWPGGGAVLRFLAVEPSERGHRLGAHLVRAAIGLARAGGASYLGLHTAPGMRAARRLYGELGFVRVVEHDFHPAAHYGAGAPPGEEPWGLAYVLRLDEPAT